MNVRVALAILVTTTRIAAAEPEGVATTSLGSGYDVGFRVGGYGFRREGDNSAGSWTLCRMNGFGLFGSKDLQGPVFLEAGLDGYFSSNVVLSGQSTDLPIDRASGLASIAIGARTYLAPWARAYVQLGAGVELTRVSVPYETGERISANKVMPEGFFGIGMDLRIMRGTYIGASFRLLAMGNFDYDPNKLEMTDPWTSKPTADQVFAASPSLASQGQFYVRRDL